MLTLNILWSKSGSVYEFNNIPVYDSPVLIADKSLLKFTKSTNESSKKN